MSNSGICSLKVTESHGGTVVVELWYLRRTTLVKEQDSTETSDGLTSQTNSG